MMDTNAADDLDPELVEALSQLDDETAEALRDLLEESPSLLRETLEDYGYLHGLHDEEVLENREGATTLSPAQQRLSKLLSQSMGNPRTTAEIVELIQDEHPKFVDEYQSAKHRSWMSEQLNALVEAGQLGRFRKGRNVRYTTDVTEAIRHWALHNDRFVEDLEMSDASSIADDTGMPGRFVREALHSILDES